MQTKSLFRSKTLAANTLIALVALYPPAGALVAAHPQEAMLVLAGLNLLLRLVTKQRLALFAA